MTNCIINEIKNPKRFKFKIAYSSHLTGYINLQGFSKSDKLYKLIKNINWSKYRNQKCKI